MLLLLGPSASGKTESAKIMINRYPISRVVTYTTRPKRINEIDGFDYNFVTETEFIRLRENNYFVETAQYNQFLYGTPKNQISHDKFIIIEPQGLRAFLKLNECPIVAIFLQTNEQMRISRMKQRKDKQEDIKKRIESDRREFDISKIEGLDLIIDTTNVTLSDLADIIYDRYCNVLSEKRHPYEQLSLFESKTNI
jgi:guanylate kinase